MVSKIKHVLVFTDYGTNPDDLLALLVLSNMKDVVIKGIVSTGDMGGMRALLLKDFLSLIGLADVSVACGVKRPILAMKSFRSFGYEFTSSSVRRPKSQFIEAKELISDVCNGTEDLIVLSLGPLTDIAVNLGLLLSRHLSFIGMGGTWDGYEYNFCIDPEATQIVLNSRIPKKVVPLDLARKFFLEEDFARIRLPKEILHILCYQWEQFRVCAKRDKLYLNDPLAVLLLNSEEIFKFERVRFDITEEKGEYKLQTIKDLKSDLELAVDIDKDLFYDIFFNLVNGSL